MKVSTGIDSVDSAVTIMFPLGTLCSAGPTTTASTGHVISYINGCDTAAAASGNEILATALQSPNGVNVGGVTYCSCYTAAAAAAASGSSIFAIGFSLLAILASLWK